MTEISERYRRNAAAFAATVASVPTDRWDTPTPCEDWDARALVRHVVEAHGIFEGLAGRELRPGPSVDDDPVAAFAAARAQVEAELDDPSLADVAYDGFTGPSTFAEGVDRFLSTDLVVHRWDLARATGGDETIPPDEVARVLGDMEAMSAAMGAAMRGPGAFAPEITPPDGADDQTRLLCFLGRQP